MAKAAAWPPATPSSRSLCNRLVHRSGFNPGPRHRFSLQVRFGDLLAPEMLARGWRNRRGDGFETFKSIHPDLIHSEEQP